MTTTVTRADLQALKGASPRVIAFFEQLFATGQATAQESGGTAQATGAIQNATVLTLSSNAAFNNERVLVLDGARFSTEDTGDGGEFRVSLTGVALLNGGFQGTFNLEADTNLDLPSTGRVPSSGDGPYANDAAAAAAGIGIGEWYAKTGGTVVWRVA